MTDRFKSRPHVHEAVEEMIVLDPPDEDDGPAVVRSWVLVATVQYGDGGHQMYRVSSDAVGENELPQWERDGLLHYAIYNFVAE